MKRFIWLIAAIAVLSPILIREVAAEPKSWIEMEADANGGCRSPGYSLAFEFRSSHRGRPFGKPAANWTPNDLDDLRRFAELCVRQAREVGRASEFERDAAIIVAEVSSSVQQAKSEVERQKSKLEAAKQEAAERQRAVLEGQKQAAEVAKQEAAEHQRAMLEGQKQAAKEADERQRVMLERQRQAAFAAQEAAEQQRLRDIERQKYAEETKRMLARSRRS